MKKEGVEGVERGGEKKNIPLRPRLTESSDIKTNYHPYISICMPFHESPRSQLFLVSFGRRRVRPFETRECVKRL